MSLPKSGPVACPYCRNLLAEESLYDGHLIFCPHCNSQCRAPGVEVDWLPLVRGIVTVIFCLYALIFILGGH